MTRQCAIILPVHDDAQLLNAHLGLLAKQTTHAFDVIVPHSPGLDVRAVDARHPFGIAFIALKSASAAAGYYAGEKYALTRGYVPIILADIDCMPVSKNLVERLCALAASNVNTIFLPPLVTLKDEQGKNWSLHWYGAMHRSVFEKAGLSYVPFYIGCVDSELELRMLHEGASVRYPDGLLVDHPLIKNRSPAGGIERILYELRNITLFAPHMRFSVWMSYLYNLPAFCFCDSYSRLFVRLRLAFSLFQEIILLRLDRSVPFHDIVLPPYEQIRLEDAAMAGKKKAAIILGAHMGQRRSASLRRLLESRHVACTVVETADHRSYASIALQMLSSAVCSDTVILCMHWKRYFNPALLLCRNLYLHDGENTWVLAQGSSIPSRIFRFLLSCFICSVLVACYIPLSAFSFLRMGGAPHRYGLEATS
jgi:GT2 family glycosyltransferase